MDEGTTTERSVREVGEGVWWLRLRGLEPGGVNAYLVDDDGTLTLIDAGMVWDAGPIRRALSALGYEVADVDGVLLTHFDLDHVGGLLRLDDLDAPVSMGAADAAILRGTEPPTWRHHKGALHRVLAGLVRLERPIDPLVDGQRIGGFTALHTPGHNPGHMVYVHEDRGFAALGDLVRTNGGSLRPMYWFDSYDTSTLRESIRTLPDRLPPIDAIGPGHGRPLAPGADAVLRRLATSL